MRMFRNFLIGLFLAAVGIGALLFIPSKQPPAPMPWEITVMPDGKSRVMGIHLGTTTYRHTQEIFHEFGKIAAFIQEGESSTVEAFFDSIHLGGLSGKLVLNLDIPQEKIAEMASHANEARLQDSGAHRYELSNEDNSTVVDSAIVAITLIPTVKLNPEIVRYRFGEPQSITKDTVDAKTSLWHYPKTGLTISLNEKQKSILLYQ